MNKKLILIAITTMLGIGTGIANAGTAILPLNPYSAFVKDGASIVATGFNGPITLPGNASTPNISFGFVIPNNYVVNSTLKVVLLWDSTDQNCNFYLRPNFLYRARNGKPLDGGFASAGLNALNASTTYTLVSGGVSMGSPAPSNTTERVVFTIKPTLNEFANLAPGDAVNFGIFREDRESNTDTCQGDIHISGVSIYYITP